MECTVCTESLSRKATSKGPIRTTPCGHLFHEDCLSEWLNKKRLEKVETTCPACRKVVDMAKTYMVFLSDESVDKQFLETKLKNIEEQNKIIIERNSILESILDEQNRAMKKEFLELKEVMANMRFDQPEPNATEGQLKELLRTKDIQITNLKKEVHDLKVQRAETAKNMAEIQKEVNDLKNRQLGSAGRPPLTQKNEYKKPISLSLKFDDLSSMDRADRLIFED